MARATGVVHRHTHGYSFNFFPRPLLLPSHDNCTMTLGANPPPAHHANYVGSTPFRRDLRSNAQSSMTSHDRDKIVLALAAGGRATLRPRPLRTMLLPLSLFVLASAALLHASPSAPAATLAAERLSALILARATAQLAARADTQSSYAPLTGQPCPQPPSHNYVRPATGLSVNETAYVAARLANAREPLRAFFQRANVSVDGLDDIMGDARTMPRVAVAISGGGYRAMLHGSGGLAALDARNESASPVAGLLQGSVYMAGLSGGSWAVSVSPGLDLDWKRAEHCCRASPHPTWPRHTTWTATSGTFKRAWSTPPGMYMRTHPICALIQPEHDDSHVTYRFIDSVEYFGDIVADVLTKKAAGFDTSITDLWGRALSYHLLYVSLPLDSLYAHAWPSY